ncbi:ABC transporter ATP-binding protein [Lactiplantibacillus pentosus]|uniref:ABC transporter ATP-binding protein n=1 Tax=Lactiplantibacillus pentosus TaxID=1589 RepID=UPI00259BC010|nr:ABC transporter ATP-binding protein [Lactiplantibacillus pentosus]MDO7803635.1 ABC transporter ATP-binding protein [Lactiplantibacillus pentosus]WFC03422.1 ABC transporter ATP-binding protein [Lactiplantibacillus pentosus]
MNLTHKKNSIFQNIHWYLTKAAPKFPKLKYGLLLTVTMSLILLVATSGVPTLIVWGLQEQLAFPQFAGFILSICVGLGCLVAGQAVYKTWMTWENANLRMQLSVDDGEGFLNSPFEESIDTAVQKQRARSSKLGYEDDDSGVALLWPSFVDFSATLISVGAIAGLTLRIQWWSPIVIVTLTLLAGTLLVKFDRGQEKFRTSLANINFMQKYLYKEAFRLGAGKDIRLYHLRQQYHQKIAALSQQMLAVQRQLDREKIKAVWVVCLIDSGQLILLYVPLVIQVSSHHLSLPAFTFFFTLLGTLSNLVRKGATEFSQMIVANENLSVGRDYLDYAAQFITSDSEQHQLQNKTQVEKIEFRNVSYHYPNHDQKIIDDVSFVIHKNTAVALVGLNGAGKSTLVALLMGLLKPTSGTILINDQPSETFDYHDYLGLFAPVFQESATFADTLANNITFGETTTAAMEAAIKQSGLWKDVQDLTAGLQTNLTQYVDDQGMSLSGGQSQKLMLARALYQKRPVLILDEPTAALDALAESELYQHYHDLSKGTISIFISHRLASTQFADIVFFVQDGRIADAGTHQDLMKANPAYAALYHAQSQYYQEGDGTDATE